MMEKTTISTFTDPTVYVVDDDIDVRCLLCDLFESIDLKAAAFESARAFLDAYQPGRPGCLILDVRMPGMSGLELQERLAKQNFDLPIIFLTGHGDVEMAVDALKAGVFDFLEKPYNTEKLLDRVQRAIQESIDAQQTDITRLEAATRMQKLTPRERRAPQPAGNTDSMDRFLLSR